MVQKLLHSIRVFKLEKGFNGENFELDLVVFYIVVRKKMTQTYEPENCDPVKIPNKENLDGLDRNKLLTHKRNIAQMSRLVKVVPADEE